MSEEGIKWNGVGVVYAIVGHQQLVFEGQVGKTTESIFVKDARSGKFIELSKEAVKQIIWKNNPTQAGAASGRRF